MPEPRYLTTQELAESFPLSGINSYDRWFDKLKEWRDKRWLVEGTHWQYDAQRKSRRRPRVYLESRILEIIRSGSDNFATDVLNEHRTTIKQLIQSVQSV